MSTSLSPVLPGISFCDQSCTDNNAPQQSYTNKYLKIACEVRFGCLSQNTSYTDHIWFHSHPTADQSGPLPESVKTNTFSI